MTTDAEMMQRVLDETRRVVGGISPSQLTLPTPCTEWDVRALLNHITGGAEMFATCVDEGSISDDRLVELTTGDNLGSDYEAAFDLAAKRAMTAFGQPGAAGKIVKLPFGEMPAGVALRIAIFDVAVHALDLAVASGQSTALDPEMLAAALAIGRQMIGPDMRGEHLFDDEVAVSPDAPVPDQLLAFAGRRS